MNPIIEKQLKKCTVANIPPYNKDTTYFKITKKVAQNNQSCIPNHYYDIELSDYVLKPPPDYSLHINWNKNILPKSKIYRCEVLQVMGTMVKINGIGIDPITQEDTNDSWMGWLPLEEIKILKELD